MIAGVLIVTFLMSPFLVPHVDSTKEKAYVAAMRSELRDVSRAEQAYFEVHKSYTDSLAELNFTPYTAVTLVVTDASASGWSAHTSHPATVAECRVGWGADSIAGTGEGVITCYVP
jgi:hypothetical protein